jgi:putative glutamine amidotransferase
MRSSLVIGITDCGKWENYARWVAKFDPQAEIVKLSWRENNLKEVARCHGLVFTGGEDVHPKFYGQEHRLLELDPKEVNLDRDEFEMDVMKSAMENELPVFGICRGLQLINVYFGGSLILDLPKLGKSGHEKSSGYDQLHPIEVVADSQLRGLVNAEAGAVNSAHHQAADRIGEGLKVSASSGGITEGLEWENPDGKPFLLLVQWHPERMRDSESPFSRNLILSFLHVAKQTDHRVQSDN